ncbi:hypothetical protein FWK35_00035690 [Aphis craccivora]|uniref:Uncharacterized protein n=1 Tax=Aphis craccivora TaxID=307492 RepID=A0A6G0VLJ9_APHCR|nr:hypothetical protein FWK35_00035690 [Aphis craccivora]
MPCDHPQTQGMTELMNKIICNSLSNYPKFDVKKDELFDFSKALKQLQKNKDTIPQNCRKRTSCSEKTI